MELANYCFRNFRIEPSWWRIDYRKRGNLNMSCFLNLALPVTLPNRSEIIMRHQNDESEPPIRFFYAGEPASLYEGFGISLFSEDDTFLHQPQKPVLLKPSMRSTLIRDDGLFEREYVSRVFSDLKPEIWIASFQELNQCMLSAISWEPVEKCMNDMKTKVLQEVQNSSSFPFIIPESKIAEATRENKLDELRRQTRLKKSAELKFDLDTFDVKSMFTEHYQHYNLFMKDVNRELAWVESKNKENMKNYEKEMAKFREKLKKRGDEFMQKAIAPYRKFCDFCLQETNS